MNISLLVYKKNPKYMGNGKPMVVSEDARKEMTEEDDYNNAVVSKNTYCIKFF